MGPSLLHFIQNCRSLRSLKSIHARLLIDASIISSDIIHNKFIRAYSRHGAITYAHKLFAEIALPNVYLWTSLIRGYVENRLFPEAFLLFRAMHARSVCPLNFTISSVLKALTKETKSRDGDAIFGYILKLGLGFDTIVQNCLLEFFMKCGRIDAARLVFKSMHNKNVFSWNSMISGYVNNDRLDVARQLFDEMPCRNVVSWTILICAYVKAGAMDKARVLFDGMPSKDSKAWGVMISGYINADDIMNAYLVFKSMPSPEITMDTWNLILSGLCKSGDFESTRDMFHKMPNKNVVSWTIFLNACFKAGNIDGAMHVFDQMPVRNVVSWTTVISGFSNNGHPTKALKMFELFKEQGIEPNEALMFELISTCSELGVLETAETVITSYLNASHYKNIRMTTSLIDMYAKCGSIERSMQVFTNTSPKDLRCYTSMIAAFAAHGLVHDAISLFEELKTTHIKPDAVTFLGVLSACNHGGLVQKGWEFFTQMSDEFGIKPSERHFACMVDLLGRSGDLEEALGLIRKMPMTPNCVVWGALLSACRTRRNVGLAEVAAAKLFRIEPENSGNYILLSNVYSAVGKWGGVAKIRAMIRGQGVKKNKGSSWIEVGRVVHEFGMADVWHFEMGGIYLMLELVNEDMMGVLGCVIDS